MFVFAIRLVSLVTGNCPDCQNRRQLVNIVRRCAVISLSRSLKRGVTTFKCKARKETIVSVVTEDRRYLLTKLSITFLGSVGF